jgi:surface antigen
VDGLLLGLGLGAVGITALALLSQPPRPAYPAYGGYTAGPPAPPAPIDWNAVDDGVTVVSEGYDERGNFCREFQKEIRIGGRLERGYGIACLQEDGSWRISR